MEAQQRLPDGRVRVRRLPLSEKLIGCEGWREGAVRAVREELGSILPGEPQVSSALQWCAWVGGLRVAGCRGVKAGKRGLCMLCRRSWAAFSQESHRWVVGGGGVLGCLGCDCQVHWQ